MDTGSHLLFGATLAGLAYIHPEVAQNQSLQQALILGTLIGSHAPDFDTVVRVKGIEAYIKYHRGITHSIPAIFIWAALISTPLAAIFGLMDNWFILFSWSFAAVLFHVFLDSLNAYGVQSLRPFSRKWIHLDILSIFEPFLFFVHALGAVLWLGFDYNPVDIFPAVYLISFLYIAIRAFQHYFLVSKVLKSLKMSGICHVFPSFHWFNWRFVVETAENFCAGTIDYNKIALVESYSKEVSDSPVVRATLQTDGVRAFLKFAQRIHVSYSSTFDGYEVRFSDVRFWYKKRLPFGVDVQLDRDLKVVKYSLGWRKKAWDPPYV